MGNTLNTSVFDRLKEERSKAVCKWFNIKMRVDVEVALWSYFLESSTVKTDLEYWVLTNPSFI